MSTMTGTMTVPSHAAATRPKARVDYPKTEEAALVRRAQAGDEMAFQSPFGFRLRISTQYDCEDTTGAERLQAVSHFVVEKCIGFDNALLVDGAGTVIQHNDQRGTFGAEGRYGRLFMRAGAQQQADDRRWKRERV